MIMLHSNPVKYILFYTLFLTQNAWLASYCAGGHADERPFRRLAISHSEDHVIRHGHVLPGLVDVTLVAVPLVQRAVLGPAHLEPVGPEDEDRLVRGHEDDFVAPIIGTAGGCGVRIVYVKRY